MALTVVVRSGEFGDDFAAAELTFDTPRIVIGRGEGSEVRLPDPSVSHRHASIRQRGGDYLVVDEGSTNGTYVGSVRLSPQSPRIVRSGDQIRTGRIWLELRVEQAMPTANAPEATRDIALRLVQSALEGQGAVTQIAIRVVDGPDAGREFVMAERDQPQIVGRGREVGLALDDPDASRHHVELVRRGESLWVKDLGSKNGSSLDGEALIADEETRWPPGAALELGGNQLTYDDPIKAVLAELEGAADEQLEEDESVDPPPNQAQEEPESGDDALGDVAAGHEGTSGAAPVLERPKPRQKPAPRPEPPRRWNLADLVIALLALSLLGLSVVGMFWLFGGS